MSYTAGITRREFLKVFSTVSAGAFFDHFSWRADDKAYLTPKKPNILLLVSDEHNPFITSITGNKFIKTPNFNRLASMGTLYNSHYCTSPLCMPSRSSFMAGKYVHRLQTYNNCRVFDYNYSSYAQHLEQQGIHTVHIGKIDVYRHIAELGFAEMYIGKWPPVRDPGDINISRNPLAVRSLLDAAGNARNEGYGVKTNPFKNDEFSIDIAIDWIKNKAPKMKKNWVMSINLSKPHFPMEVTQELWDMYEGHDDLPKYGIDCETARHPFAQDLRRHFQTDKYSEQSIKGMRRGYYGCVTYVDRKLGQLLDALQQTNQLNNTVVIYTSDHGDMHGKFGMWWKSSLYEDSARVPLIIAGPGIRKGFVDNTAVSQLDLQASIFRFLSCERPNDWNGVPLQDIPANDENHSAFCEYHGHGTRASSYMLRKGKWKYIYYCGAPNQMFNIEKDPHELVNVIEKYPSVRADMQKELECICSPEKENIRAEKYIRKQLVKIKNLDIEIKPSGLAVRRGSHQPV